MYKLIRTTSSQSKQTASNSANDKTTSFFYDSLVAPANGRTRGLFLFRVSGLVASFSTAGL